MENNIITIIANVKYLFVSYSVEYNDDDFITLDIAGYSDDFPKYLIQCLHEQNYETDEVLNYFSYQGYSITQLYGISNCLRLYFDFNILSQDKITKDDLKYFKDKCTQHFLKYFSKIIPNYEVCNVKSSLDD